MGKLIPLEVKANWLISLWVVLEIVSAGWMTRDRDGEVHPPPTPRRGWNAMCVST